MKKVLITGVSGFVGRHLAHLLSSLGVEVVGVGHHDLCRIPGEYASLDLLNESLVRDFPMKSFDAIFHLAGIAAVGPSFSQPRRYIDANAGMQVNLFEALLAQGCRPRMLIVSTGGLYATSHYALTENSKLTATNPYAVSKLTQEFLGKYYQGLGFDVVTARPFNHVGPGQGEGFLAPDLAKQIVLATKGEGSSIKVGDLSSQRDYTDVRDIVRAYAYLIERGETGETYNVCSGRGLSGNDILRGLLKESGASVSLVEDPTRLRPSENRKIRGSHRKLTRDTGWEPQIPLRQTLADVLDDWRQRLASSSA